MKQYLSDDLKKHTIASERERSFSILNSDEAKGRKKLAYHLAFDTDMSADEAIKLMRASQLDSPEPSIQTNPYLH